MQSEELLVKFSDYLKSKGNSMIYLSPISIFCAYCDINRIDFLNISYENISKFLADLSDQKFEKSYINNFVKGIKFFYKFMFDYRIISDNRILEDINKLHQLRETKKIRYYLKQDKVDFIIRSVMAFDRCKMSPYKIKAILYFMYFTGCRVEEILNLMRGDIHFAPKKNFAILRKTKNDKQRKAYFSDNIADILKTYFDNEAEEINAFNLTIGKINWFFISLKKFDDKITPHVMRHSFAQDMLRRGINLRYIQKLMGHENIETTLIYCDPNEEDIEAEYRKKVG